MIKTVNLAAVDYKVIVNKVHKDITITIIDNDAINQYELSNFCYYNSNVKWEQNYSGYVINYKIEKELKDLLKILNVNNAGKKYLFSILQEQNDAEIYVSRRGL
jgi:hypothetical protein